ncbi:HEAT repeat domain-containing protein [Paenibacillus sp. DS2015]|uniref:HEAT repeat domain-containing protein n=1 Tax=Paenibacillus sp. DS2015 TaxID=3373917 RepID=UPI003D1C70C1
MNEQEDIEVGPTYEDLKKSANRSSDWKVRLNAVEELAKLDNKQVIDVLTHMATNDPVYQVQEAAYLKLKELGEDVPAPSKNKGELFKGLTKILIRIKKSLPADHTYEDFKEKLKKMRVDIYDTYEGDKGDNFDQWLESTWASLSIK